MTPTSTPALCILAPVRLLTHEIWWRHLGVLGRRGTPGASAILRARLSSAREGAQAWTLRKAIACVVAGGLGGEGVPTGATGATDEQSLQQIAGPLWTFPAWAAVLPKLFLHGGVAGGLSHSRSGNGDPFLGRAWLHT